jgi:hypothetical protein
MTRIKSKSMSLSLSISPSITNTTYAVAVLAAGCTNKQQTLLLRIHTQRYAAGDN